MTYLRYMLCLVLAGSLAVAPYAAAAPCCCTATAKAYDAVVAHETATCCAVASAEPTCCESESPSEAASCPSTKLFHDLARLDSKGACGSCCLDAWTEAAMPRERAVETNAAPVVALLPAALHEPFPIATVHPTEERAARIASAPIYLAVCSFRC